MAPFDPAKHNVLATTSSPALGKAMKIMLKAMGFAKVEVVPPKEICQTSVDLNPTFLLFTQEYLSMPMQEMLEVGCPCAEKKHCRKAFTVIFLKKKTFDGLELSKRIGFDGIIFADQSMERLLTALKTVYDVGMEKL